MHASSPLPSPPSPGSGASPSSARPAAPAGTNRLLAAHARLASIDPWSARERLFDEILGSLLIGAGATRGVLLDPAQPLRSSAAGLTAPAGTLEVLAALVAARGPHDVEPLPRAALTPLFGEGAPAPFAIPVTAQEDVVAFMILDAPPEDAAGFASVTAHAAWLLDTVRMSDKVQKADFELKYRVWELQSLYDVGLSIARTLDLETLADDVLTTSVSLLNARTGSLLVRRDDGDYFEKHVGEPLLRGESLVELPRGTIVANVREGRPEILASADAEKLLVVPIQVEDRTLGVLVVADKETRAGGVEDFSEADERVASLFANQAAIALENARLHREAVEKEKMEREMELAASIQATILPAALPEVPGLLLAGGNRPTKQVGGDYFDVYPLAGGLTALCVADVSGKGVPAALLVSTVHACLHLLVPTLSSDLPALVARVNKHLLGFSSTRKFATLFLAVFDPATGVLRYVNAGHNPGLVVGASGTSLLPSGGVPVGMLPAAVHREAEVPLAKGDTLLLYSDGITEALNRDDEEFGMERLTGLALDGRTEAPAELSRRIFGAVSDFTAGVAQYDDQTVLIARVAGP